MTLTFEEQRTNAQKIEDEEVRRRVLRGIELLRREYGPSWADHIDVVLLDLSSVRYCVLGQLEHERNGGAYSHALERIDGELEESPDQFGFNEGDDDVISYEDLTLAWGTVLGAED